MVLSSRSDRGDSSVKRGTRRRGQRFSSVQHAAGGHGPHPAWGWAGPADGSKTKCSERVSDAPGPWAGTHFGANLPLTRRLAGARGRSQEWPSPTARSAPRSRALPSRLWCVVATCPLPRSGHTCQTLRRRGDAVSLNSVWKKIFFLKSQRKILSRSEQQHRRVARSDTSRHHREHTW